MGFRERLIGSRVDSVGVQVATTDSKTSSVGTQVGSVGTQVSTADSRIVVVSGKTDSVGTQVGSVGTQAGSVGTQVGSVGTQVSTADSRIVVIDSKTDSVGTKVGSVGTQAGSVGTQVGSVGTQVGSVGTQVGSVGTQVSTADSRIVVVDGKTDSVGTQVGSVGTQVSTADSRIVVQSTAISTLQGMIGALSNNVDARVVAPEVFVRDDVTEQTLRVWLYTYASDGSMDDPDDNVAMVDILKPDDATYDVVRTPMTRDSMGRYYYDWTIQIDKVIGEYLVDADYKKGTTGGSITETGDTNDELSGYANVTGVKSSNTDEAAKQYFEVVDDTGGFFHLDIFMDSAKTQKVGHTATYDSTGAKAIVADNTSGLGGTITIDAVGPVESVIVTYPFKQVFQARYVNITDIDPDVASRISSVGTQVGSVGTQVGSVGTQVSTADSRIVVIDGKTDSVGTKVGSVGTQVSTADSRIVVIDGKTDSVGTQVGSVGTQVGSVGTQVGSVGTQVGSVGTQVSTADSRIVVVSGKTDSVGTQVSTADSRIVVVSGKTDSVGTQVGSVGTQVGSVGTQVSTVDSQIVVANSKIDSVGTQVSTVDSKVTAIESAAGVRRADFIAYVFTNGSAVLADGGNDDTETSTLTTSNTSYEILASLIVNSPESGTKTVTDAEIDLGWSGQLDAGTGNSKWAVKLGDTPTLSGAVDIPGTTLSETDVKDTRWRSGQYKHATQMATLPFTVMLAGKVGDGDNTLTVTGLLGSTVSVCYELS